MYKLVRMSCLEITDIPFTMEHKSADSILKESDSTDSRQYTSVLVRCRDTAKIRAIEYLKGTVTKELPNGDVLMELTVVENEQLWLGTLLSLGDNVEILSPERIRRKVLDAAEQILSLYRKL